MIRLDDLVAARLIHSQRPELRQTLAETLKAIALRKETSGFRTLLGELLKQQAITREQAEFIDDMVDRFKRGRALGIYAQLLVDHGGLDVEVVRGLIQELGTKATCQKLSEVLVEKGHLDADRASRLRFVAKVTFDKDQAEQISGYQGRQQAEKAATLVGAQIGEDTATRILGEAKFPSGVYRKELIITDAAEATAIIDKAALTTSINLMAPRFAVPDWVDSTDTMVGKTVHGYRILGRIGAGAQAMVYLADHQEVDKPVALKVLPPETSDEKKARFKREILANGFFSHDNVIDIFDAGEVPGGHCYLAMEFFDGTDLDNVLETEGSVSLRQSLVITRQILEALETAHSAGIVHRDIKPSNILVSTDGSVAKLMDFGIALIKDLGDFKDKVFESDAGGVTGTPEYLSPEQAFRDPVGPQADLYSTGMVLYRMLAGRLPFASETVSGWISCHITEDPLPITEAVPNGDFPAELVDLFGKLFVKDPKKRMQTATEAREIVETIFLSLGTQRRSRFFGRIRRGF